MASFSSSKTVQTSEDQGSSSSDPCGRYEVKFISLSAVSEVLKVAERVLFSSSEAPEIGALGSPILFPLEFRSWKGAVLNVSGSLASLTGDCCGDKEAQARAVGGTHAIAVVLKKAYAPGPILVLAGLRYRGNVGTIVRSAVQANRFEKIVIIDPEEASRPEEKVPGEKLSNGRISQVDVDYYSMQNAPLIAIERSASLPEWLAGADVTRNAIATALTSDSLDLYAPAAASHLSNPNIYLLLGCETTGLPGYLTDSPDCTCLEIPSLSASVNVGCAFSIVLTVMLLAQSGALHGNNSSID